MNLEEVRNQIKNCNRCHLYKTLPYDDIEKKKLTPVPGSGNSDAKLMFIGECPGENEIISCTPFVGQAGQLLDKMLKESGIIREDCYISNIIHCWLRTPNGKKNRPPEDVEIQWCKKWIWEEIQCVNPSIIVCLGKTAVYTLLHEQLNKSFSLLKIIGETYTVPYHRAKIIPVPHPSFLLQHGKKYTENVVEIFKNIKDTIEINQHHDNWANEPPKDKPKRK